MVSVEHVECCWELNPVPPDCETGELTITLSRPIKHLSVINNRIVCSPGVLEQDTAVNDHVIHVAVIS